MWYIIKMLNKNQVDGNQGYIIIHGIKLKGHFNSIKCLRVKNEVGKPD